MKITTIALAASLLLLIGGCNTRNAEMEKQTSELQAKNAQLSQELSSRDEYIESVTESINNVYTSLEGLKAKEKIVLNEANSLEAKTKPTSKELRESLLKQITTIDSTLKDNRKRISDLQSKVSSYRAQFAGLKNMVNTLKQTIEEREQTIAQLETKIGGLETELGDKIRQISQRDSTIQLQHSTIDAQRKTINTAFYIIGKRKDLEAKGIIKKEGGFLWGLLGSTTIMANGFNRDDFRPIDRTENSVIEINGTIDEIVPKRDLRFFTTKSTNNTSTLTVTQPDNFWQDDYLVIITN
jgi:uncharacterized protein YoxC